MNSILEATAEYEAWLGESVELQQPDLVYKHQQMASKTESFPFFRGTYYRWAQHWRHAPASLLAAPVVLSVGDLHLENFGTWRDAEGRLVWGVNDFDEADYLPYPHDLVRLAASAWFARLNLKLEDVCHWVLKGYHSQLQMGGSPFVLEENHPELRALALSADRDPVRFWGKFTRLLDEPAAEPPEPAKRAMLQNLPVGTLEPQFRFRAKAGMGSLGKPRYVALAQSAGSWIAREAKAAAPPATAWLAGKQPRGENLPALLSSKSIRCPDPFYRPATDWIARRLAPRCSRIDLTQLAHGAEAATLFEAMGAETANMHLAEPSAAAQVLVDLEARAKGWLEPAARDLAKKMEADWQEWRESFEA